MYEDTLVHTHTLVHTFLKQYKVTILLTKCISTFHVFVYYSYYFLLFFPLFYLFIHLFFNLECV